MWEEKERGEVTRATEADSGEGGGCGFGVGATNKMDIMADLKLDFGGPRVDGATYKKVGGER